MLDNGFNQNEYKIGSSFKNRQLCIYYETCDHRILGSSNLDPKSELCQNIQKRVRLPCDIAVLTTIDLNLYVS